MRGLIDFANRPEVRDVVQWAVGSPAVHGVVAEYHPLWLLLRHPDVLAWDELGHRMFPPFFYPMGRVSDAPSLGVPREVVLDRWKNVHGGDPYQLRICLRPSPGADKQPPPERPQTNVRLVFEERPLARLTADSGLRARAGAEKGTIGGSVKSPNGDWLGVTCGHVVKQAPTIDIEDESGTILQRVVAAVKGSIAQSISGECVGSTKLVALPADTPCNPYGAVDPSNKLDVAFIKADFSQTDIVKWAQQPAPRASASSGQAAVMLATDGRRTAQIGGLAVYYALAGASASYCFSGLFEVLAPPHTPKIVHRGDSGAWIMRPGPSGDEWFGVVLGSDDLRGFAMFAEPIYDWAKNEGLV